MLNKKVVVVVGGAGLVGRAFVESLAKKGFFVIVADVDEEKARTVKNSLAGDAKSNVEICSIDILSEVSVNQVIDNLEKNYKRIDSVVNCAYPRNSNYGRSFFDITLEDFNENVNLHLGGYFNTTKNFARFFVKQGWGNIINISSIYGLVAPRFHLYENTKMTMPAEYAVIKSGLNHLTKYVAKFLKGKNVRINTLTLGGVLDNQPKPFLEKYLNECLNKGMLEPYDFIGALCFLLSDESQYVNGQNIVVDDGFSL